MNLIKKRWNVLNVLISDPIDQFIIFSNLE